MKKSTDNSTHYTWGAACDGWHLLQTDSLSIIQEKMPPGTSEQLHYHNHAQQFFYILSGEATFELNGEKILVEAGKGIHIPAKAIHNISNRTDLDLTFIVASEPKSHGDKQIVPETNGN